MLTEWPTAPRWLIVTPGRRRKRARFRLKAAFRLLVNHFGFCYDQGLELPRDTIGIGTVISDGTA